MLHYVYTYISYIEDDIETHNIASHINPLVVATPIHASNAWLLQKLLHMHNFSHCSPSKGCDNVTTDLVKEVTCWQHDSFRKTAAQVMVVNSSKAHKHTGILSEGH